VSKKEKVTVSIFGKDVMIVIGDLMKVDILNWLDDVLEFIIERLGKLLLLGLILVSIFLCMIFIFLVIGFILMDVGVL